jgi:uncharacterized SAM-binding protein YcdF (DUF218 family)
VTRIGIAGALLALAVTMSLGLPVVSTALIDGLQIYPALAENEIESAAQGPPAAIVILSAGRRSYAPEYGGETVDNIALERIRYGATLARRTGLPVLVSGGLIEDGRIPLARLMADVLMRDYALEAKWQEGRSGTTAENAIFSSEILKQAGIMRVVLVTHAWHMKRARDAFAAQGMTVIPAPTAFYGRTPSDLMQTLTPSFAALRMSGYAIHEIVGGLWYSLRYGY